MEDMGALIILIIDGWVDATMTMKMTITGGTVARKGTSIGVQEMKIHKGIEGEEDVEGDVGEIKLVDICYAI